MKNEFITNSSNASVPNGYVIFRDGTKFAVASCVEEWLAEAPTIEQATKLARGHLWSYSTRMLIELERDGRHWK